MAYARQRGVAPTLREMAVGLGLSSVNTPRAALLRLERRGLLVRYATISRGVYVTPAGLAAAGEGNG